jgi:hypothetical protein
MSAGYWITLWVLWAIGAFVVIAIVKTGHDADESLKNRPSETASGVNEDNE